MSSRFSKSFPLLCTAKERYFDRLSVYLDPHNPDFDEARWLISEDINVEHLLGVFTTIDGDLDGVWKACVEFVGHVYWRKTQLTMLRARMEGLPDDQRSKPDCLFELSWILDSIGNRAESKRLLIHALKLKRG